MLVRAEPGALTLYFDRRPILARDGDTVAVALLAAGIRAVRTTPRRGRARGPYCMMGACFECLATVDGVSNVQTCLTPVRDGMQVETQQGAPSLGMHGPAPPPPPPASETQDPNPMQHDVSPLATQHDTPLATRDGVPGCATRRGTIQLAVSSTDARVAGS